MPTPKKNIQDVQSFLMICFLSPGACYYLQCYIDNYIYIFCIYHLGMLTIMYVFNFVYDQKCKICF